VKKQLNIRNAFISANFRYIKVDFKNDFNEEVKENKYKTTSVNIYKARADMQKGKKLANRPAIIDLVKDIRTRAIK
jgi:hypothetical protein